MLIHILKHPNLTVYDNSIYWPSFVYVKDSRSIKMLSMHSPCSNSIIFTDNTLQIDYGLNYEDIYESCQEEFALPDKYISIGGTDIINKLQSSTCRRDEQLAYELLRFDLLNLPFLQYVKYKGINHKFQLCKEEDDIYRNYIQLTGNPNSPTEMGDNLNVAMVSSFIPHADFLYLLSIYLPKLKILCCGGNKYNHNNRSDEDKPNKMDLTEFNHLEIIYFDVNLVFNTPREITCILIFEFTNGENFKYKYVGGKNISLRVTSLHLLREEQDPSIPAMTFRCDKSILFTIYNSKGNNFIDFIQGVPRNVRRAELADIERTRFL